MKGRRRQHRLVNFVVALVLALVSAVAGATSAAAYSVPWVPPSVVSGDDVSWIRGAPVSGGWSLSYAGDGPVTSPCVVSVQGVEYTGTTVDLVVIELGSGDCGPSSYWATRPTLTCGDGWSAGVISAYGGTLPKTKGWGSYRSSYPYSYLANACASHGGIAGGRLAEVELAGSVSHWAYELTLGGVATIDMVCSDGVRMQSVSVTGVGVAAECPSGMVIVSGSLSVDGDEKSKFARPTGAGLETWTECMRGDCRPMITYQGYSCDPTMMVGGDPDWCRRAQSTGTVPSESGCVWQAPLALGSIVLDPADCASWLEETQGPPVPDPEEPDLGIITEWMQRIKTAIDTVRGAVEDVRRAIESARDAVVDAIDGIEIGGGSGPGEQSGVSVCGREAITTWYNPAEWTYDALACAFIPNDFQGTMQAGFNGLMSGDGFAVGEWGAVFGPMGPAFASLDSATCSCEGWTITFPLAGEFEVGNSCAGIGQQLADLSRAATGTLIVVGGLGACVRMIAAAFGFVALVGPAVHTELKDASSQWEVYNHRGRYNEAGKSL